MTEGAGLTSRQVATRLDALGHHVEVVVSDPICMARFTRHVRALHRVCDFGMDPLAWFAELLAVADHAGIDVVFPTQEQVTVLSHQLPRLQAAGLATAVPPFAALLRVQDKLSALRTLRGLDILQPRTVVAQDADDVLGWTSFPAFVKAPVGTGSHGVRRVTDHSELRIAVQHFIDTGSLRDGGVLVQEAVLGTFVMAQCVFDAGSLVAYHANERVREGTNGSASAKVSVDVPALRDALERLGRQLQWHGALSVDAIVSEGQPFVIDVNPRLVEPGNAMAAGTDLVGALLAVASGRYVAPAPPSRSGARTHQLLMAILGAAQHTGRRRNVLRELLHAAARRDVYAGSVEELMPWRHDRRTVILPLAAAVATLVRPGFWRFFTDGAVNRYALAPEGWRQLQSTPPLPELTGAAA